MWADFWHNINCLKDPKNYGAKIWNKNIRENMCTKYLWAMNIWQLIETQQEGNLSSLHVKFGFQATSEWFEEMQICKICQNK